MRTFGLWIAWFIAVGSLCCCEQKTLAAESHWVTTWGCGPQLVEPANRPPLPLADSTLRQFVHTTVGGKNVRVRLSNAYGTNDVTINAAHVALAAEDGSAGAGQINLATDRAMTFEGKSSVTIAAGASVLSDSLPFDLPPLTNAAISIFFGDISATSINGHPGSRTTTFIQPGNLVTAASLPNASKTAHWYIITGIEVLNENQGRAVVVLGDSITDGRGSTTDANNRWPDDLAQLLSTNSTTSEVAVVNMGIGGNGIFGGLGPSAKARFDRDVLSQSGARWVIIFEGVNDIGGSRGSVSDSLATNMIAAYQQFIANAHAHHLLAYGATITPFGHNGYFSPAHESIRQTVNTWIRTNTLYDGVIDFDMVVRDPVTLTNLLPAYNSGDGLHLSPAGYQAMANAINPTLFTR